MQEYLPGKIDAAYFDWSATVSVALFGSRFALIAGEDACAPVTLSPQAFRTSGGIAGDLVHILRREIEQQD